MKIELTKERLMAAHEKGCRTGKAMIEALAPELFEKPKMYQRGQKFECDHGLMVGKEFILAEAGSPFALSLISTDNGTAWTSSVRVEDPCAVTEEEFKKICVKKPFTPIP